MKGSDLLNTLSGIGDKTKLQFKKVSVETIDDLANFYPKYYVSYELPTDIEDLSAGVRASVRGTINSYVTIKQVRHLKIVTCTVKDYSGSLTLTWFNMPFLKNIFHVGQTYIFVGTPVFKNGKLVLEHPEYYTESAYEAKRASLQPVYPLREGLTNNMLQKAVKQILPYLLSVEEFLPKEVIFENDLWDIGTSLEEIHFPLNKDRLKKASERIIFNEFFLFLTAVSLMKEKTAVAKNQYMIGSCRESKNLLKTLPYELTNAQAKTMKEIETDLLGNHVMNRLVQGDVGSGKTILAVLALLMTAKAGYQGALMAPTEVLAEQHYSTFKELLAPYNVRIALLTGSTTIKEKRTAYEVIKQHEADIIIGTHALIQEKVEYSNLALVITDEQHRFGVRQRESLSNKGIEPHILVMSATPIPRTLAIIMYGDLDISIINELPANRLPIKNCVVDAAYRPTAYKFMEKEINRGRQVYVICPMVEESEVMEAENVIEYTNKLRSHLPSHIQVEYLHGKMKPATKNELMEQFAKKEIQVLVSTTVIEVGINVPNATVMLIENAERFGLAQLHQLRGRVGRGKHQSYCIFMRGNNSKQAKDRLEILNKSNDGFFIANEDLKLRGPGDFFGIRQSGMMDFALGDIYNNARLLKQANDSVQKLVRQGFDLETIQHKNLKRQLDMAKNI